MLQKFNSCFYRLVFVVVTYACIFVFVVSTQLSVLNIMHAQKQDLLQRWPAYMLLFLVACLFKKNYKIIVHTHNRTLRSSQRTRRPPRECIPLIVAQKSHWGLQMGMAVDHLDIFITLNALICQIWWFYVKQRGVNNFLALFAFLHYTRYRSFITTANFAVVGQTVWACRGVKMLQFVILWPLTFCQKMCCQCNRNYI